jgi:hypothetical protein
MATASVAAEFTTGAPDSVPASGGMPIKSLRPETPV